MLCKILDRQPENSEALYYRGLAYLGSGELSKATDDLQKLISRQPGFLKARLLLAEVALRERKPEIVTEQTDLILARIPDEPQALILHASAALINKDLKTR